MTMLRRSFWSLLLVALPFSGSLAAEALDTNWSGYVRAGYEYVQDDPDLTFVGNNDGFVLYNARLNLDGDHRESGISFRVGVEGAADLGNRINSPQSELGVRLRDGFVRWDSCAYAGLQVGQFKAPFAAAELRSTRELRFVRRAVGIDGLPVGRGLEREGLGVDRQVGAMLSPREPIRFGGFGVAYYAMAATGHGSNQALDDNDEPAFYGRLELLWEEMVTLGGATYFNARTEGEEPDLRDEEDFGIAADLLVSFSGLELFAQFAQVKTTFETVRANPERLQRALSAQLAYTLHAGRVALTPAYRFATLDPFAEGGDSGDPADLASLTLQEHTVGLRVDHPKRWLGLLINYTLTLEEEARELDNDRLEVMAQVVF